jgi:hypothetical protein
VGGSRDELGCGSVRVGAHTGPGAGVSHASRGRVLLAAGGLTSSPVCLGWWGAPGWFFRWWVLSLPAAWLRGSLHTAAAAAASP